MGNGHYKQLEPVEHSVIRFAEFYKEQGFKTLVIKEDFYTDGTIINEASLGMD